LASTMNVVIPDREYHEAWMREAIEMVMRHC